MQKGLATLEIIFATLIITILMSATIPNVIRVIDKVALDYEAKKLYTDLRFLQSFDRMAYMRDSHFGTSLKESVRLIVYPDRHVIEKNSDSTVYAEHYFSNSVTSNKTKAIIFDDMGKIDPAASDTLELKSRFSKPKYFKFDTVGRFRGSLTE